MTAAIGRWRLARFPPEGDEGSATAEFAVVLPSVIVIAGLLLTLARVVTISMDCQSAAAAAARELVIADDESAARLAASDVAGGDVSVSISQGARSVDVTVECPVLPGPMNLTPVRVSGEATAIRQ
jgi:Flp pilus assembly protein TadG